MDRNPGTNATADKYPRPVFIAYSAMIAAAYVVLTIIVASVNLASGAIQVRISEALTILPAFTVTAVPGLFVGCIISNIITGCAPFDVVFGSIATLIGALGTYALRKRHRILASVPPIVANTVIVPFVLKYVYDMPGGIPYFMLTVGIGEVISCGIVGQAFYHVLYPMRNKLFGFPQAGDSPVTSEAGSGNDGDNN